MAAAHGLAEPIVHCDLKPENILIGQPNADPPVVKIADFGLGGFSTSALARGTDAARGHSTRIPGSTWDYASHELRDSRLTRTVESDDVFALGVIWYELLSERQVNWRPSGVEWQVTPKKRGMTEAQLEFVQRCFGDDTPPRHGGGKPRPKNAIEMADEINRLFRPLRKLVEDDITKIAERRMKGENCRQYIGEVYQERAAIWNEAAKQGLPGAQWLCGVCWEMGRGDSKTDKYEQAASLFQKAAEQGHGDSQYSLALYHRYGIGGLEKSEQKSLNWLEKAADNGQADALYELGLKRNEYLVVCRAANRGHTAAQLWVAQKVLPFGGFHLVGFGTITNWFRKNRGEAWNDEEDDSMEKCCRWVQAAASRRHLEATFLLGKCYEKGIENPPAWLIEPNQDKAIESYRAAAYAGHAEAQFRLFTCLHEQLPAKYRWSNDPKVVVRRNEVFKWCLLAAYHGFADAQYRLWLEYENNCRWPIMLWVKEPEAVTWLCKAAAQGHSDALRELEVRAKNFSEGNDFFSQHPNILETLHAMAAEGNAQAAYILALVYSEPLTNKRLGNRAKAKEWLKKAADQGHIDAIHLILHGLQESGQYYEKDDFGSDVRQGDPEAQFHLANDYFDLEARVGLWWYQAAAEQGHQEAIEKVVEFGDAVIDAIKETLQPRSGEGEVS